VTVKNVREAIEKGQIDGVKYSVFHLPEGVRGLLEQEYRSSYDKQGRLLFDISENALVEPELNSELKDVMNGAPDLGLKTGSIVKSNVSKHRAIRHGRMQGSHDQGKMRTGR
jgi:hypothetical protein